MVELVEGNDKRDFEGVVFDIKRELGDEKFPDQYKLFIKATEEKNKDWKDCYSWVSIPSTATSERVPRKSLLGFLLSELKRMGLEANTHQETLELMRDRVFRWHDSTPRLDDENLTKKDKLLPYELVQSPGEGKD